MAFNQTFLSQVCSSIYRALPLYNFLDDLSVLILSFLETRKAVQVLVAFFKTAVLTTEITPLFPFSVLTIAFSSFLQCLQQLLPCKNFGAFFPNQMLRFSTIIIKYNTSQSTSPVWETFSLSLSAFIKTLVVILSNSLGCSFVWD